ncbi:MAG: DNA primase [Myxococcota bacterium]|nr:DNA primase [Myxococcota bacterium]
MGRIPDDTIEAVRDRVDIVELVGRHVSLRQSGRSFKGLCPFHDEKTPSFQVNPERGIFHCFGCGAGGDAFRFLMQHENLTFPEAVRVIARDVGVEVPESGGGDAGLNERLRDANEVAQRLYRDRLAADAGVEARAYLERRGLEPAEIERFGLGFAPDSWDAVRTALAAAKLPAELGEKAGLLAERQSGGHYDRLRGRVTFPIRDVRDRIVGFGGRALAVDQEPKYLNTPESPVFRKREAFYGFPDCLEAIRRSGRAVVVEGYFDRIALARAGVTESVATCGTALTPEHARQLRRRTREVVLLFDGDEAGQRAVERSLEILLPEGLRVRAGALPPGDDPDTLLVREGAEALRRVVDEAPPAIEHAIRRAVRQGCRTPWEKADAVRNVVKLLVRVTDPVERGEYARRLALAVDVRVEDVDEALRRERSPGGADPDVEPAARPRLSGPEARFARRLVRLLLDHPPLAGLLDRAELESLVPGAPWASILLAVLDARTAGAAADVHALAAQLDEEAAAELRALAVEEHPGLEADEARRAVDDTIAGLRRRRHAERRRDTTRRLRDEADPLSLLAEKQRQIEERKQTQGLTPSPTRT